MTAWRETLLRDEIELAYGKSLPERTRQPGPFGVFGSNGLVGSHNEPLVNGPGIVVGRKGSVGAVTYSADSFWPIDTTYFVVNRGNHNWRYLYYLLLSCGLTELNSHSAVPGLNREDIYSIPVTMPSRNEQGDIARVLDCVEDAINFEARAFTHARRVKDTAMRELFTRGLRGETGREKDLEAPISWKRLPISELGTVVTGSTPPTKNSDNYLGGQFPFVSPGDIEHGFSITKTQKHITGEGLRTTRPIPAGSTCFVCIGATIGKVGYTTAPTCATNQQINSVVPSSVFDSAYVFYLLTHWSGHIRQQASPSPVPLLSKGVFQQIEIMVSTDPVEQREIAEILEAIDRKIVLHRKRKVLFEALFETLLHQSMSGSLEISELDLSAIPSLKGAP